MILILKLLIHVRDPVNCDIDAIMDISIGNALGSIVQFFDPFVFQLRAGCFFCHLFQHSLNVFCSTVVLFPLIVFIVLRFPAHWLRNAISLMIWDATTFFICCFLLARSSSGLACTGFNGIIAGTRFGLRFLLFAFLRLIFGFRRFGVCIICHFLCICSGISIRSNGSAISGFHNGCSGTFSCRTGAFNTFQHF